MWGNKKQRETQLHDAYKLYKEGITIKELASDLCLTRKQLVQKLQELNYPISSDEIYDKVNCLSCGKIFIRKNYSRNYCTIRCRNKLQREKGIAITESIQQRLNSYFAIFERDDFKCVYCGKSSISDGIKLVIDHVYPVVKGGTEDIKNLVTSCSSCNTHKHSKVINPKTIIKIWQRNYQLNLRFDEITYTELKKYFKKNLHNRNIRFKGKDKL